MEPKLKLAHKFQKSRIRNINSNQ